MDNIKGRRGLLKKCCVYEDTDEGIKRQTLSQPFSRSNKSMMTASNTKRSQFCFKLSWFQVGLGFGKAARVHFIPKPLITTNSYIKTLLKLQCGLNRKHRQEANSLCAKAVVISPGQLCRPKQSMGEITPNPCVGRM